MPAPARSVRGWALVSSGAAVLVLVVVSVVAAAVQPPGYDPVQQTISTLASRGASHRWIMTAGLYAIGVCHLMTAAGLTGLPRRGRLVLAVGGVSGLGVATFAQPAHGSSNSHMIFAVLGAVTMSVWPVSLAMRSGAEPWAVRVRVAVIVTLTLGAMLCWVLWAAQYGVGLGVAERITTLGQTTWPLVVVLTVRWAPVRASAAAPSTACAEVEP